MSVNSSEENVDASTDHTASDPNALAYLIYGLVVPVLAAFGVVANLINAIVFMRPRMTPSAFTYLAALSWMDCFSCLFLAFSGFARSIFHKKICWIRYDYKVQIPLTGITTGAANLILVSVTLDRLIYLKSCLPQGPPWFCRRIIARKVVAGLFVFSLLINIPYFFIYSVMDDGNITATAFFYSTYYMVHNWITFILLAIIPAAFLLIANAIMISVIRKWSNCEQLRTTDNQGRDQKRYYYQTKLTISIVAVIFLFLVGELPAHIASKKSALTILFGGDIKKFDTDKMEVLRVYFTLLNVIQLSLNIVIYAIINPAFLIEFFDCFHKISECCHKMTGIDLIRKFYRNLRTNIWKCLKKETNDRTELNSSTDSGNPTDSRSVEGNPSSSVQSKSITNLQDEETKERDTERRPVKRVKSCSALKICRRKADSTDSQIHLHRHRRSLPSPEIYNYERTFFIC